MYTFIAPQVSIQCSTRLIIEYHDDYQLKQFVSVTVSSQLGCAAEL